ncbi:MAG: hypothetical protein K8M05_27620 [Deltaproteobacteria bacterium]|nr:hypothetical protein [Kofleriaceae bacterium]
MNIIGVSVRRLAIALAVLSACSVPPVDFTSFDDAGMPDAPPDAPPVVELVVSTTAVTVGEAATATFTVALSAAPQGSILVSVDSADVNRVGVAPTSIQFDATNWDQARTVTVSGQEDADTENEAVDVTVSSSVGTEVIDVTVTDNDSLGVVVTPAGDLEVSEGGNASLAVRLSAQPSGSVTVTVASSDAGAASVSPTTLVFGTSTWDVDQNVVVNGEQDADVSDDTATLTLSAPGLTSTMVDVQVIDDDVLGIQPSTTNLGTHVEGGTTTFTVRLTQQPTSDVTVAVTSSDPTILTVSPTPLTFTSTTWNMPQTVTVNLPEDVDTADETATIALAATGLTTRTVSATIDDDDTQVIVAAPDPVPVDEGGTRALNVRLQYQPSADITLSVTSLNTGVATVSTGTLTFTPANYDTNQMVTVSAPEDADASAGMTAIRLQSLPDALSRDVSVAVTDNDQLLIETSTTAVTVGEAGTAMFGVRLTAMPGASVTVSVSSGDPTVATVSPAMLTFTTASYGTYQMVTVSGVGDVDLADETLTLTLTAAGLPAKTVDATVTDDDTQQVVLSTATTSVNEGGTGTVGVSLAYMPAADVTVTLASADTSAATVSPATRTFTPANYATPQTITITGVSDADAVDDTTTINATAPGATAASLAVTVQDDDALGIETSVTTINVNEGGTASFNVRLTAQPTANTTVTVMSSDITAATATPMTLTFTTANYATFQPVDLAGVSDVDSTNDSVTVSLTATGLSARTVGVTVLDDDTQDILLTTTTVTVGEAGTGTFGVRLAAMPASNVVVTVASANTNKATASPSSLTFTSANYATNQTVTVSGVADLDLVNESVTINLSSPGVPTRTVTATVTDDDMQVVETTATGTINLTEGGAGATVGFRLRYIPSADTTVTLNLGAGLGTTTTTMTFTPANYNTYQNRTISAAQDPDAADVTTSLTASATGATSATVNFFIDDDDLLGLDVAPLSLSVTEGATGQVQVRLTAQPGGNTTVMVASSDATVASITAGASLTFTTANWNVYQNVTVAGAQDPDVQTEGANLTVSSAGLASRNVGVTVTDDDVITIEANVASLTVNEGMTASFGVRLSHQPASPITVTVTSSATTVVSITAGSGTLVFDGSNYATNQTVTVFGVNDANTTDGNANVVLQAPGITTKSVPATVRDDDIVLLDLATQMGPATGGTPVAATGGGFTATTTGTMNGNPVTNVQLQSPTQLGFQTPARTPGGSSWSDVRLVKGGNASTIPRAFYYGAWTDSSGGLDGGTISVVVAPPNSELVYVTAETSFYRSTDLGFTYERRSDGLPESVMRSVVVHPGDPNIVYVSTGVGIFRTDSAGDAWDRIGTFENGVSCLGIHPQAPEILFACVDGALWRSTNEGSDWDVVLDGIPTFGNRTISFTASGDGAWLATPTAVYWSDSDGESWQDVTSNLPVGSANIEAVIAYPHDNQIAWLGMYNGFFRTTDGGSSWEATVLPGQPYPNDFAIDPDQPESIYATTNRGVYFSSDAGDNWTQWSNGIPSRAFIMRTIAVRPGASELYAGSQDWSLYRSESLGEVWERQDRGIQSTQVQSIAPHPTDGNVVFAATNGGLYKSTDAGSTWSLAMMGLPDAAYSFGPVAYRPDDPSTMYLGTQNHGVYMSTDEGQSWFATDLVLNGNVNTLAVDPANPDYVYAGIANQGVFFSDDGGQSWSSINDGLPTDLNVKALTVHADQLFVIEQFGGVFRYDGPTWTASGSGLPPGSGGTIQNLWSSPDGALYAATFNDTFRSDNDGQDWGLFQDGIQYIVWDPARTETAYLFRQYQGMERTLSAFATLVPFSAGLPDNNPFFGRVAINADGNTLYYGVTFRGIYRITD